jgi:hypothetical protein
LRMGKMWDVRCGKMRERAKARKARNEGINHRETERTEKKSPRRNTDLHGEYSNRHHEEHEGHEVADAASCKIYLTADTRRHTQTKVDS